MARPRRVRTLYRLGELTAAPATARPSTDPDTGAPDADAPDTGDTEAPDADAPADVRVAAARAIAGRPDITAAELAGIIGRSERQARRIRNQLTAANGHAP